MAEREPETSWDCHRALVKSAVEREKQILMHLTSEMSYSLSAILNHLKDGERWDNVEMLDKDLKFEREYLIRVSERLLQFHRTIVANIAYSTDHLIQCLDNACVEPEDPDVETMDVRGKNGRLKLRK